MEGLGFRGVLDYYSREDVQQAILSCSKGREVASVFGSGAFGQRPGTIQYAGDVASMAKSGAVELHCSIERWSQPMAIKSDNYAQLRSGWDFIVDIDCDDFTHGKASAIVFCNALEEHGIKGYSVKFTGGTGFHIGVPWESIPKRVDYKDTLSMFPDLPRAMCAYMKDYCRDRLEKALLGLAPPEKLAEQGNAKLSELVTGDGIDPYKLIEFDSVLISPRHLFRMPYSLNMKRMLASLPVRPASLPSFERAMAEPKRVRASLGFLDNGSDGEAGALVAEAMDWSSKNAVKKEPSQTRVFEKPAQAISPENFPPCIKKMLEGMADGRKRSLFVLENFLSSSGWPWDAIEKAISEWNMKNPQPLPDNYIRTHLKWSSSRASAQGRSLLPPGCSNEGWYDSIGVCTPDSLCGADRNVKNPAAYPIRKLSLLRRQEERVQAKKGARGKPAARPAGKQGSGGKQKTQPKGAHGTHSVLC